MKYSIRILMAVFVVGQVATLVWANDRIRDGQHAIRLYIKSG
ncbi:MAG: hypothetical protein RQ760_19020 [Sedimentisphaerales bacterium]|nr:hypothetical protein [Sedimentisphaerales bacterium]